MRIQNLIIILSITLLSLQCKPEPKSTKQGISPHQKIKKKKRSIPSEKWNYHSKKIQNNWTIKTIPEKWIYLSDSSSACLTGGENCKNGHCGNEGCALSNNIHWKHFLNLNKNELSTFLIGQFNNQDTTQIHTCPFDNATKGELAVYCLQHIYKVNWYDLVPQYKTKLKTENKQQVLNYILRNKNQNLILRKEWEDVFF